LVFGIYYFLLIMIALPYLLTTSLPHAFCHLLPGILLGVLTLLVGPKVVESSIGEEVKALAEPSDPNARNTKVKLGKAGKKHWMDAMKTTPKGAFCVLGLLLLLGAVGIANTLYVDFGTDAFWDTWGTTFVGYYQSKLFRFSGSFQNPMHWELALPGLPGFSSPVDFNFEDFTSMRPVDLVAAHTLALGSVLVLPTLIQIVTFVFSVIEFILNKCLGRDGAGAEDRPPSPVGV